MEEDQVITLDDPFFNFDLPCPEWIQNCEELREKMKKDIEDLKSIIQEESLECCEGGLTEIIKTKYLDFLRFKEERDRTRFSFIEKKEMTKVKNLYDRGI